MHQTEGDFQFMRAATQPSLYRNGEVLIERDPLGNTAASRGVALETHTLAVTDARIHKLRMTCEHNGFELLHAPLEHPIDFYDHDDVVRYYYPECAALVAELTGAQAFAFDHNVRSAGGKQEQARIKGGQDVQGPAHVVHGDYTLRSAPERLAQLALPPSGNDTLVGFRTDALVPDALLARAQQSRFAIINVWRNIDSQPVATHPIALCDSQTVTPEDLVVFEIHYPDRIGENYFSKFSPEHRWYYYPAVAQEEALIIKQWDSAGLLAGSDGEQGDGGAPERPCTFSFHSAFVAADTPADARDRWSIEVRCVVIY